MFKVLREEIAESTDPEKTQIAIESYASYGRLFIHELLQKGYDIREVNPSVSNKLVDLFTEEHSDRRDAETIARALHLIPLTVLKRKTSNLQGKTYFSPGIRNPTGTVY